MASIETITTFHALRTNTTWPNTAPAQTALLTKALDYQKAFYPVRDELTADEQTVFDDAIALLALEMLSPLPVRASAPVKKLKEASSSGASIETEYEAAASPEPFPQVAALLSRLAPVPQSTALRFGRMVR